MCQKREFVARSSFCEVSRCEVSRSEVHEIFMRIDMNHSYFSNCCIICLPSNYSVVEIIIELLFAKN